MASGQEAPHQLIDGRLLLFLDRRKVDLRNPKIPEQDAVLVHIHVGPGLHYHNADNGLLPFRSKRKRHPEIKVGETFPLIDLGLVIHQASLFVRALSRPTRIGRDLLVGGFGFFRGERSENERGRGKNKSNGSFHIAWPRPSSTEYFVSINEVHANRR